MARRTAKARSPAPRAARTAAVAAVRVVAFRRGRGLAARYDAAQTTPDNRRHWAAADYLSADSAASPEIRRILRARARHEVANNSYARGMVLTLANDLVGTGPRLQMLTASAEANRKVEREFGEWTKAVDLPAKLRTMRMARAQDGEAFAVLFTNATAARDVQLDLRLIEADQVATPTLRYGVPGAVDGIVFDKYGNPQEYHVLKTHPGDALHFAGLEVDRLPASQVLHWFRADRPGQSRGLPDLTAALPLFAQLRRYTLAVLGAAEAAADYAVILKTNLPPNGEVAAVEGGAAGAVLEIETSRNEALFCPEGWEPFQMRAEQPATTYPDFKREILSEIARCVGMPFNVAACDSSAHNYASGRLDDQLYRRSLSIDQAVLEQVVLDRLLEAWLAEARAAGLLPPGAWTEEGDPHGWMWPGLEETDPRWASAEAELVRDGLTSEARYYARRGIDWEAEQDQRAREMQGRTARGLPQPWEKAEAAPAAPAGGDKDEDDDVPVRRRPQPARRSSDQGPGGNGDSR